MVKTKKFVYAKQFDGIPKESDFNLVEEDLPELQDGDFLCEAMFVSADPYMRAFSNGYHIGMTMIGTQVARFPRSEEIRKLWLKSIPKEINLTSTSVLCSKHFETTCFGKQYNRKGKLLRVDAVPTLFYDASIIHDTQPSTSQASSTLIAAEVMCSNESKINESATGSSTESVEEIEIGEIQPLPSSSTITATSLSATLTGSESCSSNVLSSPRKETIPIQIRKRVLQSKTLQFPVGSYVLGNFGWQSHTVCNPDKFSEGMFPSYIISDIPGHPLSLYLGILGMPGITAYYGFKECCNPKPGEIVMISGAGGAVGSHVGQIAKTMGCTVYGITGSDEKGEWLKSIGFDGYINYKTCNNFNIALSELTPRGIDCYFDNVGGELSSIIIQHMNVYGRVACCGTISAYNESSQSVPKATVIQMSIIMKLLTIRGLQSTSYKNSWMEGIRKNTELLLNDQLKYKETVTEGFENIPRAFIDLFSGKNIGKAIVKV